MQTETIPYWPLMFFRRVPKSMGTMQIFDPTDSCVFLTVSEETRTLPEMFEGQDCAAIANRLSDGEKYVVVRLGLSVAWDGCVGTTSMGGVPLPSAVDDKSAAVHAIATTNLLLDAYERLQAKHFAENGWRVPFPRTLEPDSAGVIQVIWNRPRR